jgi:hypothetical protein
MKMLRRRFRGADGQTSPPHDVFTLFIEGRSSLTNMDTLKSTGCFIQKATLTATEFVSFCDINTTKRVAFFGFYLLAYRAALQQMSPAS